MPFVPKKPNRRRHKKTKTQTNTPNGMGQEDSYQRFLQASAIREQIRKNLGDIFDEIKMFDTSLSKWTATGKESQGKCEIPTLNKEMEWRLHSDIRKYPEVWFRDI